MSKRRAKVVDDTRVAVMFGIWREAGKGYRTIRLTLPESVVREYAEAGDISEPDILEVGISRIEAGLRREVM